MTSVQPLFFDFATESKLHFASTEAIKSLIHVVGADVCTFRRNTQVSYRFLELASNLWAEINKLINDVETSDDCDWAAYDKYVAAIDPLEEALLAFIPEVDDEHDQYLANSTSITDCIGFINKWGENRKKLRLSLSNLIAEKDLSALNKVPTDIEAAHKHDDTTLLGDLAAASKSHPAIKKAKLATVKSIIGGVEPQLKSIQNQLKSSLDSKSLQDNSTVLVIKCAMIVYGVMELIEHGKLEELDNGESMFHMISEEVWGKAKELLELAGKHLSKGAEHPYDLLLGKYEQFLALLEKHASVELPKSYPSLLKFVGKIGRSYHAQAILLVSLCRLAAKHFSQDGKQTVKNFSALESAFDQTAQALQASVRAIKVAAGPVSEVNGKLYGTQEDGGQSEQQSNKANGETAQANGTTTQLGEVGASLSEGKISGEDQAQLFLQSAEMIKKCFEDIGLDVTLDPKAELENAAAKDSKRATQVKEKLDMKSPRVKDSELTELTINVCAPIKSQKIHTIKMKLRSSTRLSAVQWSLSKDPKLATKPVLAKSHFECPSAPDKETPLDTAVGSLKPQDQGSLYLIITN